MMVLWLLAYRLTLGQSSVLLQQSSGLGNHDPFQAIAFRGKSALFLSLSGMRYVVLSLNICVLLTLRLSLFLQNPNALRPAVHGNSWWFRSIGTLLLGSSVLWEHVSTVLATRAALSPRPVYASSCSQ
jgi:hypothetical protein